MPKFPVDAPKAKVVKAFERLGFQLVREGNHISTLRTILSQSGISRDDFLKAYEE